ncbi:MAG TPA: hypothetical protein ENK11_07625 [Phycisphaerales bacterium]|nr:hypothetical protein [Phycisphaerales bacterium]
MRTSRPAAIALVVAGLLGGCQTADMSRVTVMNESESAVLVDIKAAVPAEQPLFTDESLDAGEVRAFPIDAGDVSQVAVGVRPENPAGIPSKWVQFTFTSPMLVRVRGRATALGLMVQTDTHHLDANVLPEPDLHRMGGEPPVNPSR